MLEADTWYMIYGVFPISSTRSIIAGHDVSGLMELLNCHCFYLIFWLADPTTVQPTNIKRNTVSVSDEATSQNCQRNPEFQFLCDAKFDNFL